MAFGPLFRSGKVALGPLFLTAKHFFVGWDWLYTGNRLQETQPNQTLRTHPIDETGYWGVGIYVRCLSVLPDVTPYSYEVRLHEVFCWTQLEGSTKKYT